MGIAMMIVGRATGEQDENSGRFVVSCDVNARGGLGDVVTTIDRSAAMQFADLGAAMEYWRRVSVRRPRRYDGKPNRPLTAYTVEFLRDGVEPLL